MKNAKKDGICKMVHVLNNVILLTILMAENVNHVMSVAILVHLTMNVHHVIQHTYTIILALTFVQKDTLQILLHINVYHVIQIVKLVEVMQIHV